MAWKPAKKVKTVDQALADLSLPAVDLEPSELETDEDVLKMAAEMERQDPSVVRRARLAVIKHRAKLLT